eukprot:scaffold33658_cov188-Skeletonema_dohrnii-CCMP3373.AAC.1
MCNEVSKCDGIFRVNQERIQYSTTIHKNRSYTTGANPHHPSPTQTRSMYVTAKPCGGRPPTCRMRWELPSTHQVHLTGGGNLGSNNDNTSVIPAGTGVSVNTTGQNNIMEERSSGQNTNTLSNSRDTSNASSMGPPVAQQMLPQCLLHPMAPQQPCHLSKQQSRRRSSSGPQQLPPHDLVNNPITVEHVSGTKHKVVAMKPNPGGRKWVAADNNCVK